MIPYEVSFRDIDSSEFLQSAIEEKIEKIQKHYDHLIGCKVTVSAPHKHQNQGKIFHIQIQLKVPGNDIFVNREPELNHAHEDFYIALRDAFEAATRQLDRLSEKQNKKTKRGKSPH